MKKALLIALLSFTAFAPSLFSLSHKKVHQDGFAPENNRWISVDDKAAGGISEEEFNSAIDRVNSFYKDIVAAKGGNLTFERNWTDGTVNAYADQIGKDWKVAMFGGLARYEGMTPDGYEYVICHELGHHLGGKPRYANDPWASNEGQSDYFGGLKCLRRIWADEDNILAVSKLNVEQIVIDKCNDAFEKQEDAALCERIATAGKVLAKVLNELDGSYKTVKFETPDKKVVTKMYDSHPQAQCRLDTYLASALCKVDYKVDLSDRDVLVGTCNQGTDSVGFRPRCWYKP